MEILGCLLIGFLLAELATMVTTLYLHRSSTHKSVKFHFFVEFVFQLILWLTTGINRKEWVAVHLSHHSNTDKEGDPHSPVLLGFWRVQLGNVLLYRRAARDPKIMKLGERVNLSWAEKNLFTSPLLGLSIGIGMACLIFGWWQGLLISLFHTVFYLELNSLVNAYCHLWGYKNFPEADAFNSKWVAWITGGEGFHNAHHYKPGSPKLSNKKWEFDMGWVIIKTLKFFRLAETK